MIVTASPAALVVVHTSLVQRVVREAPAVTRGGVARLVTMVPLDDKRRQKLAEVVSGMLSVERMENDVAVLVERALGDDLAAVTAGLTRSDVSAVISAAMAEVPDGELERFVADPKALPDARRKRVKALVDVTWSPSTVDALTRAPVAAAGRIVASALERGAPGEDEKRGELSRIADTPRPGDARALVVAFAFLWRDLDDVTLDSAQEWFAGDLGRRSTEALVASSLAALDGVAAAIEAEVAR